MCDKNKFCEHCGKWYASSTSLQGDCRRKSSPFFGEKTYYRNTCEEWAEFQQKSINTFPITNFLQVSEEITV